MGVRNTTQGSPVIMALLINGVFGALNSAGSTLNICNPGGFADSTGTNLYTKTQTVNFRNASTFELAYGPASGSNDVDIIRYQSNNTDSVTDYRHGLQLSAVPNAGASTNNGRGYATNGSNIIDMGTVGYIVRGFVKVGQSIYIHEGWTTSISNTSNPTRFTITDVDYDNETITLDSNWTGTTGNVSCWVEDTLTVIRNYDGNERFRFYGDGTLKLQSNLSSSGAVSASTYYGDGSNLTGISSDPFPYTGSAVISGSLEVTGSTNVEGTLDVTGNTSILNSSNQGFIFETGNRSKIELWEGIERVYIQRQTDDSLRIGGYNGDIATFKNGGQVVGIGTTSPGARLHVKSANDLTGNYALKVQNNSDTDILTVENDGKVGIGTDNPDTQLHLQDGTSRFKINTTGHSIEMGSSGNFFNTLTFGTGTMTLNNSGNTGNDTFKAGPGYIYTNQIRSGINGNQYSKLTLESKYYGISTSTSAMDFMVFGSGGSLNTTRIALYNGDNGAVLLQPSSGNVGIGTNSTPSEKLTVEGNISASGELIGTINGGTF